jgi:hypothetical protein
MISSERAEFVASLLRQKFEIVVLDVETLDSKPLTLWNEPIVSFSISLPSDSIKVWDAPTICFVTENTDEEPRLLELLRKILCAQRKSIIAGHNISYRYKYISQKVPWICGYDLPKIQKRGMIHGIDFNFLQKIQVFDSMDEAFQHYDHSAHNRQWNGEKQRILRCEHIEEDFNIVRPKWLPKLGHRVRDFYFEFLRTGKMQHLKIISQYNACDTIVESIITKIFLHSLNGCNVRSKMVSPVKRCQHIPRTFLIESNSSWQRFKTAKLTRIDKV